MNRTTTSIREVQSRVNSLNDIDWSPLDSSAAISRSRTTSDWARRSTNGTCS